MGSRAKKWVAGLVIVAGVALSNIFEARAEPDVRACPTFGVLDPWQKSNAGARRASECEVHWLTRSDARAEQRPAPLRTFLLSEVVDPWAAPTIRREPSGTWLVPKISASDIVDPWSHLAAPAVSQRRSEIVDPWRPRKGAPALPSSGL